MNYSTRQLFENPAAVRQLQQELRDIYHMHIEVDGKAGRQTINALNRSLGVIAQDGIVESATIFALQKHLGIHNPNGEINQATFNAFHDRYAPGSSQEVKLPPIIATGYQPHSRRNLRAETAPSLAASTPAPTITMQPAGTAASYGYAFEVNHERYRYIAHVDNGRVTSHVDKLQADGTYAPSNIKATQMEAIDHCLTEYANSNGNQVYRLTAAQLNDPKFTPQKMPPLLLNAAAKSDGYIINALNAAKESNNPAMMQDVMQRYPETVLEFLSKNTGEVRDGYKYKEAMHQAADNFVTANSSLPLTDPKARLAKFLNDTLEGKPAAAAKAAAPTVAISTTATKTSPSPVRVASNPVMGSLY